MPSQPKSAAALCSVNPAPAKQRRSSTSASDSLMSPQYVSSFQVLLRIELRQINLANATQVPEFIRRSLQDTLRLRISYPDELGGDDNASARRALRDGAISDWLNAVRALVILDGFDEITHKARRDLVVEE